MSVKFSGIGLKLLVLRIVPCFTDITMYFRRNLGIDPVVTFRINLYYVNISSF